MWRKGLLTGDTYGHLRRKFIEEVMVDYRFYLNNFTKMAYINRSELQTVAYINSYQPSYGKLYYRYPSFSIPGQRHTP
jgi:hypothetical protein